MLMLDNVRRFYAEAKRASSIALGSSETFAARGVVYISTHISGGHQKTKIWCPPLFLFCHDQNGRRVRY